MNLAVLRLGVPAALDISAEAIGAKAVSALCLEVETWPKPGLVSHIDNGSHKDMDARMLRISAKTLRPFFTALAAAGTAGASMEKLRAIGVEAEAAMMQATGGINTHRGAIFGLGLLCAAAGTFGDDPIRPGALGKMVTQRWHSAILRGPVLLHSHGLAARRLYGVGGAPAEAASGFPHIYEVGLPALHEGRQLCPCDPEAARVQACFALIAQVEDTNLLYRGGSQGLNFARAEALAFLRSGGVGRREWRARAAAVHRAFIARGLSPGGSADLLAMTLFVDALETRAGSFQVEST